MEFLDGYAQPLRVTSLARRLSIQSVRMLRSSELGDAYADAWLEWEESEHSELWEKTTAGGLS